jgi:hypothetical protein
MAEFDNMIEVTATTDEGYIYLRSNTLALAAIRLFRPFGARFGETASDQ